LSDWGGERCPQSSPTSVANVPGRLSAQEKDRLRVLRGVTGLAIDPEKLHPMSRRALRHPAGGRRARRIEGTREVLPAKGVVVHRDKQVKVTILPPVDPAAHGAERRRELMVDVRRVIAEALGQSI
jgi:hypothetical protein